MKKTSTLSLMALGLFSVCSLVVNGQVLNEGFEGGVPPGGWSIDNQAGAGFSSSSSAHAGSASAFLDIYNAAQTEQGTTDALITNALNLSATAAPSLTFYYAYQMWSDPAKYNTADALNIYTSTDGGASWNPIHNISGNGISTATPPSDSTNGFVPQAADWRLVTVDISSVATSSSVQFKIEFLNDWENNLYVDDVMVSGGNAVNNIDLNAFVSVYPSPSAGPVNVDMAAFNVGQTDIIVYNMVGEVVERSSQNLASPKRIKLNLDNQPNGSYFVTVKTVNGSTTKKVVICK